MYSHTVPGPKTVRTRPYPCVRSRRCVPARPKTRARPRRLACASSVNLRPQGHCAPPHRAFASARRKPRHQDRHQDKQRQRCSASPFAAMCMGVHVCTADAAPQQACAADNACIALVCDGGSASRGGAEARARALLAWALVGVRTADWYGHTQTGSTGAKSGNSVGQECGTAVWDKSVGQKCRTKVWDESVGQKCGTKVSDSTQKTSVTDVSEAPGRGFTTRGSGAHGARPPPEVGPHREAPGTPEPPRPPGLQCQPHQRGVQEKRGSS